MSLSQGRWTYLLAGLALASLTTVACGDDSGGGSGGGTGTVDAGNADAPAAQSSQQVFTQTVAPLIMEACAGCHATQPPTFAAGTDLYTSVTTTAGVLDLNTPINSRLLRKGQHAGRAWTVDEEMTILTWIELEAM